MSTLHASPDLLSLRVFLKAWARLYVILTLLLALMIWIVTRPKLNNSAPTAAAVYVSRASLLLPANTRFQMKSIFAGTGQSDLDFWLSDESLFQKFLERQKVYEKVEARLRLKYPKLAPQSRSVSVMALQVGGSRNTNSPANSDLNGSELVDPFARQSEGPEVDYAQLEENDEERAFNQRKVNRIVIQAEARDPQDSKILVEMMTVVLQRELEEVATRRARAQRRMIENYIRVGSKKVARAQKALQRDSASEPEKLLQLQQRAQVAESRGRGLSREIADLSRQLEWKRGDSAFRAATQANPAQVALEALQQQIHLGEQTYLPSSSTLGRLRERLPNLQKLAERIDAEMAEKATASLQASLLTKQRLLQEVRAELQQANKVPPSERDRQQFKLRERELAAWEVELLSWQKKLLQVRIEERLCKGDGTAVLLQAPRPGARTFAATQQFLTVYRRTLKMLPLAPLASLVLLLLIHLWQEARQIRSRAAYFFDAPVLGELPSLQRTYRQAWQELKSKGRSESTKNLSS